MTTLGYCTGKNYSIVLGHSKGQHSNTTLGHNTVTWDIMLEHNNSIW